MNLFSDLIDVLGKAATQLKALIGLTQAQRDKFRQVFDETYCLIDATLNMVILRLGDILQLETEKDAFLEEAGKLDNLNEWMRAEREIRLCKSLRVALRETETLRANIVDKAIARVGIRDWDALLEMMRKILSTEAELAGYIGAQFSRLADLARRAKTDAQVPSLVREKIEAIRSKLVLERRQLIQHEIAMYETV